MVKTLLLKQCGRCSTGSTSSGARGATDSATGNKSLRVAPYSSAVEVGNVKFLKGRWNEAYFHELEVFPLGKFKDQVDASGGAFAKLNEGGGRLAFAFGDLML